MHICICLCTHIQYDNVHIYTAHQQKGLGIRAEHDGLKRGLAIRLPSNQPVLGAAVLEHGIGVANVVERVEDHENLVIDNVRAARLPFRRALEVPEQPRHWELAHLPCCG